MTATDKVLVVIPYSAEGPQGKELWYAVSGWRKHFKENYIIVVVGDYHPVCETGDDITCIRSPKVGPIPGMYRQHLDYVSCLKKVRAAYPESGGFIMVADDLYCVNDFALANVMLTRKQSDTLRLPTMPVNAWQEDRERTRILLEKEGYPTRNYTTHLPQWYEWDKLEALWDKYDMARTSYVMEDLYYNIYEDSSTVMADASKLEVYDPCMDEQTIRAALREKLWINNSPAGWTPVLNKILSEYYSI